MFDQLATLSDPLRARLMRLVEHHELSVGEIASVLQLPQSTTSRHLKVLTDDGWLSARREATSRLYRLAMNQLSPEQTQLWHLVRSSAPNANADDARLSRVLLERQSRSQAFFAGAALEWDRHRAELFGADLDRWVLPALLPPRAVVADLGCGTGKLAETIAPFASRLVGIDASEAMIQSARKRLAHYDNVELRHAELESIPLEAETVDLALMVLVLHYVPNPTSVLREARRILRPTGRLVIVDMQPHTHESYRQSMGHQWLGFEATRLDSWLAEVGLGAHYVELPPDPSAKGPALFVCTAAISNGSA